MQVGVVDGVFTRTRRHDLKDLLGDCTGSTFCAVGWPAGQEHVLIVRAHAHCHAGCISSTLYNDDTVITNSKWRSNTKGGVYVWAIALISLAHLRARPTRLDRARGRANKIELTATHHHRAALVIT